MKTDYSKIAERYDKNEVRRKDVDPHIRKLMDLNQERLSILDLACGTGKYLKVQTDYYGTETIDWKGMDQSPEMLKIAESKETGAELICSPAEDCPLKDSSFHYIRNEYAWHHFTEPVRTANQIFRILKKEGLFSMINICPDYMQNYWVHKYFPSTKVIDRERFTSPQELHRLFQGMGFTVKIRIKTILKNLNLPEILKEAGNRDISQLTLISDEEYQAGLKEIEKDREKKAVIIHDMAFLNLEAWKS